MNRAGPQVGPSMATNIHVGSSRGDTDTALSGANTRQGSSETLTPKRSTPVSQVCREKIPSDTLHRRPTMRGLKLAKEKMDDILTHLADLFGQARIEGTRTAHSRRARRDEPTSPPDSEHGSLTSSSLPVEKAGSPTSSAPEHEAFCEGLSDPHAERTDSELPTISVYPTPVGKSNLSPSTSTRSVPELEASAGQSPFEDESASATLSDTHTERGDSAPSTPREGAPALPKLIKEEEDDDPLTRLVEQLGDTNLGDTGASGGGVRPEREEDESTRPSRPKLNINDESHIKKEPPTPCGKASPNICYYFQALSGLYYFDDYRNVFYEDGALVHDGSNTPDTDDLLTPHFFLDNIPFWFVDGGLLFQGVDGGVYSVTVWKNDNQKPKRSHKEDPLVWSSTAKADTKQQATGSPSHKLEDDRLASSPAIKADPVKKQCFYASGQLYYFDDRRKLYSEDGKLECDCSSSFQTGATSVPSFYIEGTPFWFASDGLYTSGDNGVRCLVHTWLSNPESPDKCLPLDQRPVSLNRKAASESTTTATPKSSTETCALNAKSKPLEHALNGVDGVICSPSNDTSPGPSDTATDYQPLEELSLFLASEPIFIPPVPINPNWVDSISMQQKVPGKAQPGKKQRGQEHRRCPYCLKVFRRPCALVEHINTHTGAKPHACPFVDCNTGFATRQNMRRHFLTHQVGEIEKYIPGMTAGSASNKRKKAGVDTLPANFNRSLGKFPSQRN
ncbi:unnamed protein product [Rhizoctonia solani]|uniref:C2H2-type domain-containing protein n=1 Tax=Rhizoctonia solani TaxID=456999 RepID=A0A8H3DBA4_9AGAM|nr:unnamed protein product [Rhizoctonia solani]CAE6516380.1 unnamed protein product [Rhizoctonia solani]